MVSIAGLFPSRGGGRWFPTAVAVSVAAVASTVAVAWIYREKGRRRRGERQQSRTIVVVPPLLKKKEKSAEGDSVKADQQPVPADVLEAFEGAASRVRSGGGDLKTMADSEKLTLYALYKQSKAGDAPRHASMGGTWNIMEAQAKHGAWSRLRGMSKRQAAIQYVAIVEEIESRCRHDEPTTDDETASEDDSEDQGTHTRDTLSSSPFGGGLGVSVSRPALENGGSSEGKGECAPSGALGIQWLEAAGQDDVESLEHLLRGRGEEEGIIVLHANYADESGQTALHVAADRGHLSAVEWLLDRGAAVNAADEDGISVLQAAVIAGHIPVCRMLLERGADPDQEDRDGDTPRSCASDDGSHEMRVLFRGATAARTAVPPEDTKANMTKTTITSDDANVMIEKQ